MKKLLCFVLAAVMFVTILPVSVCAGNKENIFGPNELDASDVLAMVGIVSSLESEDDESFIHGYAQAGTYLNNSLQAAIAPTQFSFADYGFIKLEYRTDSSSNIIDISSRSSVGESWFKTHPECVGDGKWHEIILDISGLTGGVGPVPAGDNGAALVLKPFGSQTVTLEKDSYFDIKYVAFFDDEREAAAYKFTKDDDAPALNFEAVDVTFEKADVALIEKYMTETDNLIAEIKNSKTTAEVTGTKYYVSNSGDDSNDGLTPETAWQTVYKVNTFDGYKPCDGVLFKRGDSWRQTFNLDAVSGVTYSAYGSGEKPKLILSVDGSDADKWILTEFENIYAFAEKIPESRSVGTIVFDGGRAWGIQIQKTTEGNRHEIGRVFNGIEWFDTSKGPFEDARDLDNDLEFYHDWSNDTLYVYSKDGNPGNRFSSIEIVDEGSGILLKADEATNTAHDIVIDNIEVFGAGTHGIGSGNIKNVTVQYCVFSWIGGSVQGVGLYNSNYGVRLGNAVESYGSSDNFVVHHNYASQIYDCCWTIQYSGAAEMKNIEMYNNVSEYCNTGLEIWQVGGTLSNMQLHDNYTRFNGYGWSHQRVTKDGNFFYGGSHTESTYEGNDVYNNINLFASCYGLQCAATGYNQYNFHDNVYIMENDKFIGKMCANPALGIGAFGEIKFDEKNVKKAVARGFEKGGEFYYTDPSPFGDMFDLYDPDVGVDIFEDVTDDFWGRKAIDYVTIRKYFNGISDFEFAPNSSMTRGMLVTVLSRMAREEGDINNIGFVDVNKDAWYADGVAWAEGYGIVDSGEKFRPNENVTREELADMLYRYARYECRKIDLSNEKSFNDSSYIKALYADGVKFCTINGIITGYGDGTVRPQNSATRAEVAAMIMRFNNYLVNAPIDKNSIFENAEYTVIKGNELKKLLDNTLVRAVVEEDSVVFRPFTANGRPVIDIMNQLYKNIDFADYKCAVISFDGQTAGARYDAELVRVKPDASKEFWGISFSAGKDAKNILFDYSSLKINKGEYNLALRLFPWSLSSVTFGNDDYFEIKEIILFGSVKAAKAYIG